MSQNDQEKLSLSPPKPDEENATDEVEDTDDAGADVDWEDEEEDEESEEEDPEDEVVRRAWGMS
ncbi:MAG: hypothetical protein JO316_03075 [Abitibacteriaceae bacterium]|nr:hypothetical protein [Abditibacteriaceae bacterium]MBV9864313.1 hypothetical protein [Abditibacteriaceae bacterium]